MSYLQLETLSGPIAKYNNKQMKLGNQIKYGAAVRAQLEAQGTCVIEKIRPSALLSNVLTPIGQAKSILVDDLDIFEGYNKSILDEEGLPDAGLVANTIKSASALKSDIIHLQSRALATMNGDNCVSLIYNMLRLWVIKSNVGLSVPNDYTLYNDGHVSRTLADTVDPTAAYDCQIADNFMTGVPVVGYDDNSVINENTSVIKLYRPSEADLNVISICAQAWQSNSVYRVCHKSPRLAEQIEINGLDFNHMAYDTDVSKAQVMMTLQKFVTENRLEGQFDLAYLMLCQILLTPVPRAVEAFAWSGKTAEVRMPRFKTLRGVGMAPLSGQPTIMSPIRYTTWRNFVRSPTKLFTHAITYTEHVHAGIFELATANTAGLANVLAENMMLEQAMASPLALDAQAIFYRTGKTFSMPWNTTAGVSQFDSLLTGSIQQNITRCRWVEGIDTGYEYVDVGNGLIDVISGVMRPVLYPCLSLGVNDDRFYINSRVVEAELHAFDKPGILYTNSSSQMNKFMAIMRLMGYDVSAKDRLTGLTQRNWAANANGAVMPAFRPTRDGYGSYVTSVSTFRARAHNWLKLPDIHESIKLKATLTEVGYRVIIDGLIQPMTMVQPLPVLTFKPSEFKGSVTYLPVDVTGLKLDYHYSDFRFTGTQQPNFPPIVTLPLQDIAPSLVIDPAQEEPTPEEIEDL